jgi:1,4-dihydroxy-6-naphthoate synthase
VPVTADIETLNRKAEGIMASRDQGIKGGAGNGTLDASPLELTAISCAQFPHVQDRYAITSCGASMGERYGPKLIARKPMTIDELRQAVRGADQSIVIAVPGVRTSAFAALSMLLGKDSFQYEVVPFETIIDRVADGSFVAGLIIHEGQLTFEHQTSGGAPLHLIQDLGAWWWQEHQLPLPLGINVIRRDLEDLHGPGTLREITTLLRQSVEYALAHREESIAYAMQFARGIPTETADEFVRMYVNKWTLEFGPTGRRAVEMFLELADRFGLIPSLPKLDFVEPRAELRQNDAWAKRS